MNHTLLLAGGQGERIGGKTPKQYLFAEGKMILTYALEALLRSGETGMIWVVADEAYRAQIIRDIQVSGSETDRINGFVRPGETRQLSIRNGLQEIFKEIAYERSLTALSGHSLEMGEDTVFIHDAARPMLSEQLTNDCFAALEDHDGVLPVLPMKDTVYFSEDGHRVDQLLSRQRIYAGQAPELFVFRKYYDAVMALSDEELMQINGSTEIAIKAGMDIVMIPGDENNFKLTTLADLERFREIVRLRQTE